MGVRGFSGEESRPVGFQGWGNKGERGCLCICLHQGGTQSKGHVSKGPKVREGGEESEGGEERASEIEHVRVCMRVPVVVELVSGPVPGEPCPGDVRKS